MIPALKNKITFHDFHPKPADLYSEVLQGLSESPKKVAPKFFYDERGSKLFDEITRQKEYYLTSTEISLLKKYGGDIGELIGDHSLIIEYGCGNSEKIHLLLAGLNEPHSYVAVDISKDPLLDLTRNLAEFYPDMDIHAVCADFTVPFQLPLNGNHRGLKRTAFFPGSSIGNFEPDAAREFLNDVAQVVGDRGALVIGVDLDKDEAVLNSAYNDKRGITAEFNKNLLMRINRECGSNFRPDAFRHHAFYNSGQSRVEMHLESLADQKVRLKETCISFKKGETIHTENSYKYSIEAFRMLAVQSGWKPVRTWTDPNHLFSLHYLAR